MNAADLYHMVARGLSEAKAYVGRRPTPKALEARGRKGGREGGDSRGKRVGGGGERGEGGERREKRGRGGERRERDGHRGEYRQHRRIYTRWLEARGLPSRRAKPALRRRPLWKSEASPPAGRSSVSASP